MFTVTVDDEMLAKIEKMLKEEDDDSNCVRLREYKMGGGCHSKIILGLSIEEMDEDEDEKIDVRGVPFIAEKDFLLKYGKSFQLKLDDDKQVVVTALES